MPGGMLDELQRGVAEIREFNAPEYEKRLRALEIKMKDLEQRLTPFLEILKVKGGR